MAPMTYRSSATTAGAPGRRRAGTASRSTAPMPPPTSRASSARTSLSLAVGASTWTFLLDPSRQARHLAAGHPDGRRGVRARRRSRARPRWPWPGSTGSSCARRPTSYGSIRRLGATGRRSRRRRRRGRAHRGGRARGRGRDRRRRHPGRAGAVADRRVGELHQGLLHRPGAGRPGRLPRRQRAPAPAGPRRRGRRGAARRAPRSSPIRPARPRSSARSPARPGRRSSGPIALAFVHRTVEPPAEVERPLGRRPPPSPSLTAAASSPLRLIGAPRSVGVGCRHLGRVRWTRPRWRWLWRCLPGGGGPGEALVGGGGHGPAGAVGDPVVVSAQQGQVPQMSVGPWCSQADDVVGVAPAGGGVAAGEDAAAVASGQRSALSSGGPASVAAHVERDAEGVHDEGDVAGVAQQMAHGVGDDRVAVGSGDVVERRGSLAAGVGVSIRVIVGVVGRTFSAGRPRWALAGRWRCLLRWSGRRRCGSAGRVDGDGGSVLGGDHEGDVDDGSPGVVEVDGRAPCGRARPGRGPSGWTAAASAVRSRWRRGRACAGGTGASASRSRAWRSTRACSPDDLALEPEGAVGELGEVDAVAGQLTVGVVAAVLVPPLDHGPAPRRWKATERRPAARGRSRRRLGRDDRFGDPGVRHRGRSAAWA